MYCHQLYLVFVVFVFIVFATIVNGKCPRPELIKPCHCDEEGLLCLTITNHSQLMDIFQSPSNNQVLRNVWIYQTNLTSLKANNFGNYLIGNFYMDLNEIQIIESKTFGEASKTMKDLSLTRNKLEDFPFQDIAQMIKLRRLGLGYNRLTKIKSNAFPASLTLKYLDLSSNQIDFIGENAFSRLTGLEMLDLSYNRLKQIISFSMSFPTLSIVPLITNNNNNSIQHNDNNILKNILLNDQGISVYLCHNQIETIAFDGFYAKNSRRIQVIDFSDNSLTYLNEIFFGPTIASGTTIRVSNNPFTCDNCHLYRWLIFNSNENRLNDLNRIQGFVCPNGDTIENLTLDKIGCLKI